MSWGSRPKPKSTTLNHGVLDDAVMATLKAIRVVRTYDVPYVGSCNDRGDTIYIDHELPPVIEAGGKRYDVDRYIVIHEVVEMLFEQHLNFRYEDAHQIALHLERSVVESDGLSWSVYNRFCSKWAKKIGSRGEYPNTPPDLYLRPERDESDRSTLKRMRTPDRRGS
jgi:hypothetical protein